MAGLLSNMVLWVGRKSSGMGGISPISFGVWCFMCQNPCLYEGSRNVRCKVRKAAVHPSPCFSYHGGGSLSASTPPQMGGGGKSGEGRLLHMSLL